MKLPRPHPDLPTRPLRLPQKAIPYHIHIPRTLHATQFELEALEEGCGAEVELCPCETARRVNFLTPRPKARPMRSTTGLGSRGGLTSYQCTCERRGQKARRICRDWRRKSGVRASGKG